MTSVVMSDSGGNIVEYVTVMEEPQQVGLAGRATLRVCLRSNMKFEMTWLVERRVVWTQTHVYSQHKTTWNIEKLKKRTKSK